MSLLTQTLLWVCDFSLQGLMGCQGPSGWYVGVGNTQKNNDVWNLHWKLRYRILSYEMLLYNKKREFLMDLGALSWLTGTKQCCWEQDLKPPALLHVENGTGIAFALHFFLLRWHKPPTKDKNTKVCVNTAVCVTQTHTNKSVFLRAQLPLEMLCLRITWFLAGLGFTVTRAQDLEHSSLHTHHKERAVGSITTLLLCAATSPAHPAALSCCVREHVESSWVFRIQEKEKKNYSLLLKIAFQCISHGSQLYSHIPSDTESALKSDCDAFAALKLEVKWQQPEHWPINVSDGKGVKGKWSR